MAKVSDQTKQKLALSLHKYKIMQFGTFTFKSGVIAPCYIDLRMVQSYPEVLHNMAAVYAELIKGVPQDVLLAGIPEAGIPLATAVGYETKRPLIQPRTKVKEYGKGKSIEGEWKAGDQVAIIDDLITKGDAKIMALDIFKDTGLKILGFYVLLDYEKGGRALVEKAGYKVEVGMTVAEVVAILYDAKKITSAQRNAVISFIQEG